MTRFLRAYAEIGEQLVPVVGAAFHFEGLGCGPRAAFGWLSRSARIAARLACHQIGSAYATPWFFNSLRAKAGDAAIESNPWQHGQLVC